MLGMPKAYIQRLNLSIIVGTVPIFLALNLWIAWVSFLPRTLPYYWFSIFLSSSASTLLIALTLPEVLALKAEPRIRYLWRVNIVGLFQELSAPWFLLVETIRARPNRFYSFPEKYKNIPNVPPHATISETSTMDSIGSPDADKLVKRKNPTAITEAARPANIDIAGYTTRVIFRVRV